MHASARCLLVVLLLLCGSRLGTAASEPRVSGPNLVINGGFEQGAEGWNKGLRTVDSPVVEGQKACVLDGRSGRKTVAAVQPFVALRPRTSYRFSISVKRTTGEGYVYVHCNFRESPDRQLMSSKNWSAGRAMPVTIRTGEATGAWQRLSGVFRCDRAEFGGVQLVIFLSGGNDTVYLDDVRIEPLQYPPAPPWSPADDVVLPGNPSRFQMRVEDAGLRGGGVWVRTTGAEYELEPAAGVLRCRQRLERPREVAEVAFSEPLGPARIARRTDDVCVVVAGDVSFGFQGDSLVLVAANRPLRYKVRARFAARHFRSTDQHFLALDDEGGLCALTHARPRLDSEGSKIAAPPADPAKPDWTAEFEIAAREMGAIAVCPGRPFDWQRSFAKRIVNTAGCPTPEALRAFSRHANVLFLFAQIYRDHPGGTCHAPYEVADPARLRETIRLAHEWGMQVICYQHPTSYVWARIPLDETTAAMKRLRAEFGFDGWYFDGLYYEGDWMETYRFIRTMRDDVGADGVIYTHCTLNPPARMCDLYCPFVDSYSDFLLRGEGQTIDGPKDPYLRYVVNTYKISNAIATLKGDRMLREGAAEPVPPQGKRWTLDESRAAWRDVAAPLHDQLDVMLRLNGRCRWAYPAWPPGKAQQADYIDFYFQELDRMQSEWQRSGRPLPQRWP